MALFEAIYGKKYWLLAYWDDIGERKILGLDMIIQIEIVDKVNMIRKHLMVAQDMQK